MRKEWKEVSSFICYYGRLNSFHEAIDMNAMEALKAIDVAIIHRHQDSPTAREVKELKDSGCYVIEYLSIGETNAFEEDVAYFIMENGKAKRNGFWGSYFVDVSNVAWHNKVVDTVRKKLEKGIDGIFLDNIDTVDVASGEVAKGMITLLRTLRITFPDIKIIANRGFNILPSIVEHIDGVMFESFNTSWDYQKNEARLFNQADKDWIQSVAIEINKLREIRYFPVFSLNYIKNNDTIDTLKIYDIDNEKFNFIPYYTTTNRLDEINFR